MRTFIPGLKLIIAKCNEKDISPPPLVLAYRCPISLQPVGLGFGIKFAAPGAFLWAGLAASSHPFSDPDSNFPGSSVTPKPYPFDQKKSVDLHVGRSDAGSHFLFWPTTVFISNLSV